MQYLRKKAWNKKQTYGIQNNRIYPSQKAYSFENRMVPVMLEGSEFCI